VYHPFCSSVNCFGVGLLGDVYEVKMKSRLLFISAIVLGLGLVASIIGFSNNSFFLVGIGGFLTCPTIMAFYMLRKV
jgi:hypothetical protein